MGVGCLLAWGMDGTGAPGQTLTFSIPAKRGQIVDLQGRVLARSSEVRRLMLWVPRLSQETAEAYVAWVDQQWPDLAKACPEAVKPEAAVLKEHFLRRRAAPIPISEPLIGSGIANGRAKPDAVEVRVEFARHFPMREVASHAVGYTAPSGPMPASQRWAPGEPLWREGAGRAGMEAWLNRDLAGSAGELTVRCDEAGKVVESLVTREPIPGKDVVTTLKMEVQEAAEKALADGGRNGAIVVVNAVTGDVLALASGPAYDAEEIASERDGALFVRLAADPAQPLLDRAAGMRYPPGSVMKPIVALAGLRAGVINPSLPVPCGPDLNIDGFEFHNWTTWEKGGFDLRAAITRSCNTYFFQAAIATGDREILAAAREFGIGLPFAEPLAQAAHALLPERIANRCRLADFVIGHGGVAVSPLEVAMAMAALANGEYRPRVRLVAELRDQAGRVLTVTPAVRENTLGFAPEHVQLVHRAMYSVVNHRDGTAREAHLDKTRVHGKTGTAQWSSQGALVNAVWFAGFVKDCDPPLAFAVAVEGKKGERIQGGTAAAPVAGQLLAQIFAQPQRHGLRTTGARAPWEVETLIMPEARAAERGMVPAISASGYSPWFRQPDAATVRRALPAMEP